MKPADKKTLKEFSSRFDSKYEQILSSYCVRKRRKDQIGCDIIIFKHQGHDEIELAIINSYYNHKETVYKHLYFKMSTFKMLQSVDTKVLEVLYGK